MGMNLKERKGDFPGSLVVKISAFSARDMGSIPAGGTTSHMPWGMTKGKTKY